MQKWSKEHEMIHWQPTPLQVRTVSSPLTTKAIQIVIIILAVVMFIIEIRSTITMLTVVIMVNTIIQQ